MILQREGALPVRHSLMHPIGFSSSGATSDPRAPRGCATTSRCWERSATFLLEKVRDRHLQSQRPHERSRHKRFLVFLMLSERGLELSAVVH